MKTIIEKQLKPETIHHHPHNTEYYFSNPCPDQPIQPESQLAITVPSYYPLLVSITVQIDASHNDPETT